MKKKTKIIATISDKNCEPDFLKTLYNNGMDVVRINTAHATRETALKIINNTRKVSDKIAILLDTKGPEIRTTKAEVEYPVKNGDIINIKGDKDKLTSKECIYVSYNNFVKDIPVGTKILFDDGILEVEVIEKTKNNLICEVKNDGIIEGKKSVNIPSAHINLPSLSRRDIDFINFAVENNLDFIAHSFVRSEKDIIAVQSILGSQGSNIKIISKIENQEGVDNIEEILKASYGIMVARGDLAIEISAEKMPIVQKALIKKSIEYRKPVIVATQLLHSMMKNPRPTRAEVNDIANAIYDGTDALMLSGETANGKFPAESVATMTKISREIENNVDTFKDVPHKIINNEIASYLVKAAVKSTERIEIKAIIADTHTGRTVRDIASYRGKCNTFVQCYSKQTMRELALTYGVYADYMQPKETSHEFIQDSLHRLLENYTFNLSDTVTVIAGNYGNSESPTFIEIKPIANMLDKTYLNKQ